jgi:Tir chaperone family protein CesT
MVQGFLEKLCAELEISPVPKRDEGKVFHLHFAPKTEIALMDLDPGVEMRARLADCPKERREELFIYVMRANLLGQGTGASRIGLDDKEKFLTLSVGLPYEMNYHGFKEAFEEFVNHLVYWRDVLAKFEKNETVY